MENLTKTDISRIAQWLYLLFDTSKMTAKTYRSCLKILLFVFIAAGCSRQDKTDENDATVPEAYYPWMKPSHVKYPKLSEAYKNEKRNQVERFCNKYFRDGYANISMLVAKNGQIIYERYQGYANKNRGTDITADTPMHIASVSKVFTATAILLLADKGKLELDQKVSSILPEFPFTDISVRNLLSHRSGLRNYAYFVEDPGVWDLHKTLTNQDVLNLFNDKGIKCDCSADHRFCYCNTNYAMLALVIEKITGMPYPQAMKTMIFEPIGMTNTYVFEYDKDRETATPSYYASNMQIAWDHLDKVYGDKNIYSTPRDMLKFDLARNAPTFLNDKLRSQIYQGYSNEHKGEKNYGLGIRMIEWKTGQKFYFHNGWWHGNTSAYIPLAKDDVVIIAFSNKFNRNTYAVRKLAPLFGDYPFDFPVED